MAELWTASASSLELQVGDQIVEVNGVDFTNVDHKEVGLKMLFFITAQVCLPASYRRTVVGHFNPLSKQSQCLSRSGRSQHILTHFWRAKVLLTTFPGCESPEEQQKSDHYRPDRSCKYTTVTAAVWYEFVALILKI